MQCPVKVSIPASIPTGVPLGPFADFDALVAAHPTAEPQAVALGPAGEGWIYDGGWIRFLTPAVANAAALPTPAVGETFQDGMSATGEDGAAWFWSSSFELWVRITTPNVANAAALPTTVAAEMFCDGSAFGDRPALRCKTDDDGVVYEWDGASWNATP